MPVETTVTRCGNCGATLQRAPNVESITCTYCEQSTWLAPTRHDTRAIPTYPLVPQGDPSPQSLHARLLQGPLGEAVGRAQRLQAGQVSLSDPASVAHAVWPSGAEASTTFGGSWSPSSTLGPPRVFPRHGDIGGAWAPAPQQSPVEWIETRFANPLPVRAVRVFETNRAGSTYAVVDVSRDEALLFAGPVTHEGGARVLEVLVDPPRVITAVRVYVVNRGWTEIDTVGLVTATPLPPMQQVAVQPRRTAGCALVSLAALGLVVALSVVGFFLAQRPSSVPARVHLPVAQSALAGGTLSFPPDPVTSFTARGVVWASALVDHSSEYSATRNAASDVLGPPDVFPLSGDRDGAWASSATDGGEEWVTVRFPSPVRAASVVWLETFHPGAVSRIDDVSDGGATTLWSGAMPTPTESVSAPELTLLTPRVISAVRIVLDTRRVAGWNEIDAIGLIPAP